MDDFYAVQKTPAADGRSPPKNHHAGHFRTEIYWWVWPYVLIAVALIGPAYLIWAGRF